MLVGLVLVGAMNGVGGVLKTWQVAEQSNDGLTLAEELMAEILAQHYKEPVESIVFGSELLENLGNRSAYDDVDDYHNWSSAPESKGGASYSDYSGWTREVTVNWAKVTNPAATATSDKGLKRIVVTVTDPSGDSTTLVAYRSQWGGHEEKLERDATVINGVASQIQVGGKTLYRGVPVSNYAGDD